MDDDSMRDLENRAEELQEKLAALKKEAAIVQATLEEGLGYAKAINREMEKTIEIKKRIDPDYEP